MNSQGFGPAPDAQVFVISVAAELSGLHPQTLRTYDRLGIVEAGRAGGGGRRYSMRDIELLRQVARLTAEGLGLELQAELDSAHRALGTVRNLPARVAGTQVTVWKKRPTR